MSESVPQEPAVAMPRAFESVYREHHPFVWRSVRRLGIPDAEVDDVVQDVFMVVHRRLDDFEGRSSIRTWLFAITYRVVRDRRRSAAARVDREGRIEPPRPPTEPDQHVARHQAVVALDDVLAQLDEDQRTTFVMAEVLHMRAPEIAEVMEVKLNTVYSRLRRAREAFDAALERWLADHEGEMPWLS